LDDALFLAWPPLVLLSATMENQRSIYISNFDQQGKIFWPCGQADPIIDKAASS